MEELTDSQKKIYICKNSRFLQKDDAIDVAKLISRNGYDSFVKFNSEGAFIDLDKLGSVDPNIINQIYYQVKHKLSK